MVKATRWLAQAAALLVLLLAPALQMWAVGSTTRWDPRELEARYGPLASSGVQALQAMFGDPPAGMDRAVLGGAWSLKLGPLEFADPLALLGQLWHGIPPVALLFGGLLVVVLHLLTGRAFCGYLCPYGTLSRWVTRLRPRWAVKRSLPRWPRWVALVALLVLPAVGWSVAAWLPYLGVWRLSQAAWFGGVEVAAIVVAVPLFSDWLLWEHGVCRALCPSGALQRLLGRWRVLRLLPQKKVGCTAHCHACAEGCWLDLDPRAGKVNDDCDGCGRCIAVCPASRLVLTRLGQTP